jgi:DNA-binding HxlR family transcriptional regulator
MRDGRLLRCKWVLHIILKLTSGRKRPSQLLREIEGIKDRVLFDRLSRLVNTGLVIREASGGYPKETYYYLKNPSEFLPLRDWIFSAGLSVEAVVKLFSCKWTLPIMKTLREPLTPSCIKRELAGISDKVLQERLRELERLGIVHREVLPSRPPRVLYSLTAKGQEILPLLLKLDAFTLCKPKKRSPCPSPERDS